jgi:hypothetical protein
MSSDFSEKGSLIMKLFPVHCHRVDKNMITQEDEPKVVEIMCLIFMLIKTYFLFNKKQKVLGRTNLPTFSTYVIACNGCHSNIS